jgi:hypothetical protein
MKKFLLYSACCLFIVIGSFYCSNSQSPAGGLQRVVIIRHGEKPEDGDNLSCQGLNRALQLPAVLNQKIGRPDAIFVPSLKMGKSTSGARMYQTIVPFAVKYNLAINSKFDVDDADGIAGGIKKATGTVLLVWEHKQVAKILKALGLNEKEKWDDDDFDSMLIISYKNGTPVLTRDHEGLHPATNCQ